MWFYYFTHNIISWIMITFGEVYMIPQIEVEYSLWSWNDFYNQWEILERNDHGR
jgi:hypothetical protein